MAHGNPRIMVCTPCKMYIKVPRFSETPDCPNCGNQPKTKNMGEIKRMFWGTSNLKYPYEFEKWFKL